MEKKKKIEKKTLLFFNHFERNGVSFKHVKCYVLGMKLQWKLFELWGASFSSLFLFVQLEKLWNTKKAYHFMGWMQGIMVHFWCHNGVFCCVPFVQRHMVSSIFKNLLIGNWMSINNFITKIFV